MKEKIRVQITQEDIAAWNEAQCPHPLIGALRRCTQTFWRMVESNMVVEKAAPYRTLVMHSDLLMRLLDFKSGHASLPCECEIELVLPFYD